MLPDEDLIEITPDDMQLGIDPDGTPRAEPAKKTPEQQKKAEVRQPDPGAANPLLESLRKQFEAAEAERLKTSRELQDERRRREEAEQARTESSNFAHKAHWGKVVSDYDAAAAAVREVTSGLAAAKNVHAAAKEDLRRAAEDDNATPNDRARRIADATENMARAAGTISSLEQVEADVKAREAQAKQAYTDAQQHYSEAARAAAEREAEGKKKKDADPAQQQRAPTADEFIAKAPDATQPWLRQNKAYATPGSKEQRRLDVFASSWLIDHNDDRASLNTPEFVAALDAHFFPKAKEADTVTTETEEKETAVEEKEQPQRQSAPAAPVSRGGTPSNPSKPGSIKLTREQYAIAPDLYPASDYEAFSPEVKAKFPQWSETAARFQYNQDLQRALKEKAHRFTS